MPTDKQIQGLWERCADKWEDFSGGHRHWMFNGKWYEGTSRWVEGKLEDSPPIDLNNLFKYAVPKLVTFLATQPVGCPSILAIYRWIFERWLEELKEESDFATAFFNVCYKAFGGNQ